MTPQRSLDPSAQETVEEHEEADVEELNKIHQQSSWKSKVTLLVISFAISGLYTLATYFFPTLRNLPVFGLTLAESWLWTLNPSLAYVGQGIIMGPRYNYAHADGSNRWLGYLVSTSKEQRMGPRACGRLGEWIKRLDYLDLIGDHACRLSN